MSATDYTDGAAFEKNTDYLHRGLEGMWGLGVSRLVKLVVEEMKEGDSGYAVSSGVHSKDLKEMGTDVCHLLSMCKEILP